MKFHTNTINYLDAIPTAVGHSIEDTGSDNWEEDSLTVSSDLGFGNAPNHHGSFDELPSTTSSITSFDYQGSVSSATAMESQEIFFDALEEAPVAYLDPEEANSYLKSVLKVKSKTVSKNSSVSVAGDALNSAN